MNIKDQESLEQKVKAKLEEEGFYGHPDFFAWTASDRSTHGIVVHSCPGNTVRLDVMSEDGDIKPSEPLTEEMAMIRLDALIECLKRADPKEGAVRVDISPMLTGKVSIRLSLPIVDGVKHLIEDTSDYRYNPYEELVETAVDSLLTGVPKSEGYSPILLGLLGKEYLDTLAWEVKREKISRKKEEEFPGLKSGYYPSINWDEANEEYPEALWLSENEEAAWDGFLEEGKSSPLWREWTIRLGKIKGFTKTAWEALSRIHDFPLPSEPPEEFIREITIGELKRGWSS